MMKNKSRVSWDSVKEFASSCTKQKGYQAVTLRLSEENLSFLERAAKKSGYGIRKVIDAYFKHLRTGTLSEILEILFPNIEHIAEGTSDYRWEVIDENDGTSEKENIETFDLLAQILGIPNHLLLSRLLDHYRISHSLGEFIYMIFPEDREEVKKNLELYASGKARLSISPKQQGNVYNIADDINYRELTDSEKNMIQIAAKGAMEAMLKMKDSEQYNEH